jgi:hypothetical protein
MKQLPNMMKAISWAIKSELRPLMEVEELPSSRMTQELVLDAEI